MKHLEEEIEDLEALDKLRIHSAEIRDQGRKSLRNVKMGKSGWHEEGTWNGSPHVIKALCDDKDEFLLNLVSELKNQKGKEIFDEKVLKPDRYPVLRAARSIQALAAAPSSAFSETLLLFYYQIIRELYTADAPDWSVGGARVGEGGSASAYITGECIRAVLGFTQALANTSSFIDEVRSIHQRKEKLQNRDFTAQWRDVELKRLKRDFCTSVGRLLDNTALDLDSPKIDSPDSCVDCETVSLLKKIEEAINKAASTFERVERQIIKYRSRELSLVEAEESQLEGEETGASRRSPARKRYERSETGHAVALGAIRQGFKNAKSAAQLFTSSAGNLDSALSELAKRFREAAQEVQRLIRPAELFLSNVLDRELTAASSETRPGWDPAEMAFAAASYGYATGHWDDDRLRVAGLCLSEELSERGRFRSGKPFFSDAGGTHADVLGTEVLRAFAQLLENVTSIPVNDRLIKRMLLFFEDTRRKFQFDPQLFYWCSENVQEPPKPLRWVTALSVLALDRVNRMLDARINAKVFQYFSVKQVKDLKAPRLRDLFYPDYGLRNEKHASTGEDVWRKEESVALVLERMRAHVLGLSRQKNEEERLFSLILHGPPGTGKTTIVKALAKSSSVPFVEITPSDLVSSGAEAVERRARAAFKALSLLTRVVILFDEFDPVLKRRRLDDPGPSTVFSFVTPGMLPKLQHLHDMAKRRSVAYVLVTNLIGTLDPAAVRSGRFDRKLGIYPPDPLSREGRLLDEVLAFEKEQAEKDSGYQLPSNIRERIQRVVQKTPNMPMGDLSREGWFIHPKGLGPFIPKGSPFKYLVGEGDLNDLDTPQPEAKPEPPRSEDRSTESSEAAGREYRQWSWIWEWDENLKKKSPSESLQMAIESPPDKGNTPSEQSNGARTKKRAYLRLESKPPEDSQFAVLIIPENEQSQSSKPQEEQPLAPAASQD